MVYRQLHAAPESRIAEDRRGRTVGQFCLVCAMIYPEQRLRHIGKPMYGRDHIASPCAHEGDLFEPGAAWWEPAVEVLPEAAQDTHSLVAGAPVKGTEP